MMPIETIGFVIEKMRKIELWAIGVAAAGLCRPRASNQPIWPRRATIMVTPGMVPLSMSRLKASDIRCSRMGESPSDSGLAWGSGGVRGAAEGLAADSAVMILPLVLLFGGLADWRMASVGAWPNLAQNTRVEQGVSRKLPAKMPTC
jgi:hypothetical protein